MVWGFSKCKKMLKRRIPFDISKLNLKSMEESTVYIENFPLEMTSEDMAKLFKRAGLIRHISMPKFKDRQPKGFCFVEFASAEIA